MLYKSILHDTEDQTTKGKLWDDLSWPSDSTMQTTHLQESLQENSLLCHYCTANFGRLECEWPTHDHGAKGKACACGKEVDSNRVQLLTKHKVNKFVNTVSSQLDAVNVPQKLVYIPAENQTATPSHHSHCHAWLRWRMQSWPMCQFDTPMDKRSHPHQ